MNQEIEKIKKIFEHVSIDNFIKYYEIYQENANNSSNENIYREFEKNNEKYTKNSQTTRASKGKSIFREGLEIPALLYITQFANENKLDSATIPKAKRILDKINKLDELINSNNNNEDTKKAEILVRLGQSNYRKRLINYWEGSSISDCKVNDVLVSSHIKPYKECKTIEEKYDLFNGLLLTPNYDKLFDNYLITFDEEGKIIISKKLNDNDLNCLGIDKNARIKKDKFNEKHKKYLKHHNETFKIKEKK